MLQSDRRKAWLPSCWTKPGPARFACVPALARCHEGDSDNPFLQSLSFMLRDPVQPEAVRRPFSQVGLTLHMPAETARSEPILRRSIRHLPTDACSEAVPAVRHVHADS